MQYFILILPVSAIILGILSLVKGIKHKNTKDRQFGLGLLILFSPAILFFTQEAYYLLLPLVVLQIVGLIFICLYFRKPKNKDTKN